MKIDSVCQVLSTTTKAFESAEGFVGEDSTVANLPKEMSAMTADIYPTFNAIHQDIFPLIQDTASYSGKKLLWSQLTANYANAIEGLVKSISTVISSTESMNNGTKYAQVEGDFSSGIVGTGDGLNAMHGKVISIMDRKNIGNENFDSSNENYLFKESKSAMTNFDKNYSTIASHMYWDIYSSVYMMMGLITICIGLLLCFISKPLTKLMHGVE
mgnify:FL=1